MFEIFPIDGGVCAPRGFVADGLSAGLKEKGLLDIGYIYMQESCEINAVFTQNSFQAAPIVYFKNFVMGKKTNFILINTKNANAMTGERGVDDIREILEYLQYRYPQIQNPIMSSTGVIGVFLPKEKIIKSLDQIQFNNKDSLSHNRAAKAIMTTDRFEKEMSLEVVLEDGRKFRIGAMAKGAGMIQPSLATMLCFITTDAKVSCLQRILERCVEKTFNTISVDGDMSTNDSVFIFSNALAGEIEEEVFEEALYIVMDKLARDIVRDGEGSSKVVGFRVSGALNYEDAKKAAKALSNSLLVKTALFGGDPNWGRIASTIGASGVACDAKKLVIKFEEVIVYNQGEILFTPDIEKKASLVMRKNDFMIECDLGLGNNEYTAYGCDLGYEYIKINADYRS